MKVLKSLRIFFILGNILLLFPNFFVFNKRMRVLAIFLLLAEIILSLGNGIVCAYYNLYFHFPDLIYFNLTLLNSVLFMILSCYKSENYKKMFTFLDYNNSFATKDDIYLKNFQIKKKILLVTLIPYIVLKTSLPLVSTTYFNIEGHGFHYFVILILKINSSLYELRFFYTYYILYVLLYLISEQLESMIRSIAKEKQFITNVFEQMETFESDINSEYKNITSEWSDVFTFITEAIIMFNKIFSLQMTLMFSSAIVYITLFLYDIAVIDSRSFYSNVMLSKYLLKVLILHVQIFVLSKAGQRVNNNVELLKRRVGKLLIRSLTNLQSYGVTKDLLQHISNGRTKIQAFGSINIDMSLPPTFIMLFTSYTVIALQFNNVL
nr:gustatory receptor 33 [Papilio dardanus]